LTGYGWAVGSVTVPPNDELWMAAMTDSSRSKSPIFSQLCQDTLQSGFPLPSFIRETLRCPAKEQGGLSF